jgi:hypothetical protein
MLVCVVFLGKFKNVKVKLKDRNKKPILVSTKAPLACWHWYTVSLVTAFGAATGGGDTEASRIFALIGAAAAKTGGGGARAATGAASTEAKQSSSSSKARPYDGPRATAE